MIFEYWNERNKSNKYSIKLNKEIKKRTNQLKKHPFIGYKTNYKEYRSVAIGNYSLIYTYLNKYIYIVSFWDNRQNPSELLKILKTKH